MERRYNNRLIITIVSACLMGASVSAAATPNDTPLSSAATMGSLEQDSQAFTQSSLGIENSDPDQIPVVDLAQLDSAQLSEFEYKEITFYDPESDRGVIVVTQDHAAGLSTASPQADSESDISSQTLIVDASAVIDSGDYAAGKYAELRVSRYTQSDLDTSMDLLGEFLLSKGLAGAIEYDPWTDTIVLNVPVGANLQLPVTQVPARVEEVANVGASVYNDSMPLPVRGGGAIYAGILRCTSGIPAYNAAGTRGFFTAGHCFKASSSVYTNSNARTFAGRSHIPLAIQPLTPTLLVDPATPTKFTVQQGFKEPRASLALTNQQLAWRTEFVSRDRQREQNVTTMSLGIVGSTVTAFVSAT